MGNLRRARVIPVLLIRNRKLVKTTNFKNEVYVGDPINALRIFNEKEVDELVVVDIGAYVRKEPDFEYVNQLVSECFMPLAYGGGIQNIGHAKKLFAIGVEKVVLGAVAFTNPELIREIATEYGSQSILVSIDYRNNWLGRQQVYIVNGSKKTGLTPLEFAKIAEQSGAGEILLQGINSEGTGRGYDTETIQRLSKEISIPLIALGGAGKINDFTLGIKNGASAVAAGSLFLFKGPHKAVLISYPGSAELNKHLG
jgi:imidazole glycerol-phosphate synthase subunit HisF